MRATLEKLVVEKLIAPLTEGEHSLLRTSTLFRLPLPLSVWKKFAAATGLARPHRLLAFGLWERLPDIADPYADAAGPNAIAAARLPSPPDEEAKRAIASLLPDLFTAWGGADQVGKPTAIDIELTRLALACGNLDVLAVTGLFAIRGLEQAFAYREAASIAVELGRSRNGGRVPEMQFLRAAAEIFDRVGDPEGLRRVYAGAAAVVADDGATGGGPSCPGRIPNALRRLSAAAGRPGAAPGIGGCCRRVRGAGRSALAGGDVGRHRPDHERQRRGRGGLGLAPGAAPDPSRRWALGASGR